MNINNNNTQKITINKLVIQGNCVDNLEMLLKYQNLKLIGIEDTMDQRFKKENQQFQEGKSDILGLDKPALFNCVSKSVMARTPDEFNIIHKTNPKEILIYHDGEWETYLEKYGVYRVVGFLRENIFNEYEIYLLKRIHTGNCKKKMVLTANLEMYYKFLIAFDMVTEIEAYTDDYIMGREVREEEYRISSYAINLYNDIKKTMKDAEKSEFYNSVLDIIKGNTANSIQKVNLAMMEILRINEEFRTILINKSLSWITHPPSVALITESATLIQSTPIIIECEEI